MHISKVSKSFNEEVSFLFSDDRKLTFHLRNYYNPGIFYIMDANIYRCR